MKKRSSTRSYRHVKIAKKPAEKNSFCLFLEADHDVTLSVPLLLSYLFSNKNYRDNIEEYKKKGDNYIISTEKKPKNTSYKIDFSSHALMESSSLIEHTIRDSQIFSFVYDNDVNHTSLEMFIQKTKRIFDGIESPAFLPIILMAPKGTISREEGLEKCKEIGGLVFIETDPIEYNPENDKSRLISCKNIQYLISLSLDIFHTISNSNKSHIKLLDDPKEIAPGVFVFYDIPANQLDSVLNPFPEERTSFNIYIYDHNSSVHVDGKFSGMVKEEALRRNNPTNIDLDNEDINELSNVFFDKNGKINLNERYYDLFFDHVEWQYSAMLPQRMGQSDLNIYLYGKEPDYDEAYFNKLNLALGLDKGETPSPVILIAPKGTIAREEALSKIVNHSFCAYIETDSLEEIDAWHSNSKPLKNIEYVFSIAFDLIRLTTEFDESKRHSSSRHKDAANKIPFTYKPKEISPGVFVSYHIPEDRLKNVLNPFPTKEELEEVKRNDVRNIALLNTEKQVAPPATQTTVTRVPPVIPATSAPAAGSSQTAAASSAQAVPLVETPIGVFPLRSAVPIQPNPALRAQEHTELFPELNTSAIGASTDVAPIPSSIAAVEAPKRKEKNKGKGKEKATNSGSFSAGRRLTKTATFFRSLSMHRNNNRQFVRFTDKEEHLLKMVASREASKEILDNYLSIITDHPSLFQYFRNLQICLDNIIGALKSISSGKIDASNFKKNIIDLVGQGIGLFALFLPVPPMVQAIPIILSFVIGNIEDAKIQALANKVSKFFPDTSEYGALIKILCILLTIHLRNEILDISAIAMLPEKSKELSRVDQLVATHFNNIMTFFGSIDDDATPSLATWFPSVLATFNITLDPNVKIKEGASAHDYALKVVSESASGRLSFTGTRPAAPAGPSKRSGGSQCVVS